MNIIFRWAIATLACSAGLVFGQTNHRYSMEEVIIHGDRDEGVREELWKIPGGVSLITSKEIDKGRTAQLKDVLQWTPGVWVQPRQGSADESVLSIRGSGIRNSSHLRGIRLYLDGMLLSHADGFSDFDTIELLAMDRIEVFKGANGLEIGANSLGGGINLVSKTGENAEAFKIRNEFGSFGFVKGQISSGQSFSSGWDYYVSATAQREDGYRQHQDLERERFYGNWGWKPFEDTRVRFYLTAINSRNELAGGLTKSQLQLAPRSAAAANVTLNQRRDVEAWRAAVSAVHYLDKEQRIETNVYDQWKDLDHPLGFGFVDNEFYDTGTEVRYVNTSTLGNYENEFVAGLAPQYGRILDANYANNGGSRGSLTKRQLDETWNVGAWVQDIFTFLPSWKAIAGTHFAWTSRRLGDRFLSDGDASGEVNYTGFSPRLGMIHEINPKTQMFGNLSMAYEPPVFQELTLSNTSGLVNLEAQKCYQAEVGTRGEWDRFQWDLSVYHAELEDELFADHASNGASLLSNIPRSRRTGVEWGVGVKLWEGLLEHGEVSKKKDYLKLFTTWTWSDFKIESDGVYTGKRLPVIPENHVVTELSYHHPCGFYYGFTVETVPDGYFVDKGNNLIAEGFTLLGMKSGMEFENGFRLFGELRNLTDVTYAGAVSTSEVANAATAAFRPGDGFAMYGGVEWKY